MYYHVWCSILVVLLHKTREIASSPQWPRGKYALLKPKTDCPKEWKDRGWVFLDTKLYHNDRINNRSKVLHIDGYVGRNFLVRYFCIKREDRGSKKWPQGQYCIYRDWESSLLGMKNGSINIYGDNHNNKDASKYISSFRKVFKSSKPNYQHTKFYFSCQTSGNKTIPIELPITKPFYLLPYGSRDCQQVKWMVATREWIKYHTRDSPDNNIRHGTVPHVEDDENHQGLTEYYCYYQSCNYTLTETKGVFQSPGFPSKYPDGQLCSWRIMVPANHTLDVHFTNFSLGENDVLKFCKRKDGGEFEETYTLRRIYLSGFSHTSYSDVVFIFHSDHENASSGFRAEYTISLSKEKTVPKTTKPTPTTKWTTMTEKRKLQTMKRKNNPQTTTLTKITKASVTTQARQITAVDQEFSANAAATTSGCKCKANIKKPSVAESKWSRNWFVVIVIPVIVFLLVLLVVVNIAYRCRSRQRKSRTTHSRSVDRLPVVINPTYERGAILLNLPNDTTASPAAVTLDVNDDANSLNQYPSDRPPDYEDIECINLDKTSPNINPEHHQGCNGQGYAGSSVLGDAHGRSVFNEQTTKTTENPVYESIQTSPPLVEANSLYESTKVNQGKAKETKARKAWADNQLQQGRDRVEQ